MNKGTKFGIFAIIGIGVSLFGFVKFDDWLRKDRKRRFSETYDKAFDDGWKCGYRMGEFNAELNFDK